MADIAIFRINYKSDFILTLNSDAGWLTPFCIKFWTGAPSQAYYAYYDGMSYTHCTPVDGEPTKLLVQFDDHHLPIGDLKFQIGYHFTVADFPTSVEDEVINQASVIIEVDDAPAQVMLDFNGETAPEIQFALPAYVNEAQRIANEQARIAAEEQRIANEQARISAEGTRQQNEQQRISNEEARVREFARLKTESEAATDAANIAATLANEKAQLADDKAALAQAAAGLANAKAQLAADKAALAQAAATLANEKAALAQQKAEYAQEQGDAAKTEAETAHALNEEVRDDEEARDQAEQIRQQQETARQQAESQRVTNFNNQMQQQQTAYTDAEAARDTAFDEAETERDAKVDEKVADITNLQAQIGYFVCDTAAATAAKTIAATGYSLATGGNIRIKMTNANTADAVTLNINNTGAKALFYNGEQASSTNSWEAGEVVAVYYDGTQFQCQASKGGGDAVGEIKLDDSNAVSGDTLTKELRILRQVHPTFSVGGYIDESNNIVPYSTGVYIRNLDVRNITTCVFNVAALSSAKCVYLDKDMNIIRAFNSSTETTLDKSIDKNVSYISLSSINNNFNVLLNYYDNEKTSEKLKELEDENNVREAQIVWEHQVELTSGAINGQGQQISTFYSCTDIDIENYSFVTINAQCYGSIYHAIYDKDHNCIKTFTGTSTNFVVYINLAEYKNAKYLSVSSIDRNPESVNIAGIKKGNPLNDILLNIDKTFFIERQTIKISSFNGFYQNKRDYESASRFTSYKTNLIRVEEGMTFVVTSGAASQSTTNYIMYDNTFNIISYQVGQSYAGEEIVIPSNVFYVEFFSVTTPLVVFCPQLVGSGGDNSGNILYQKSYVCGGDSTSAANVVQVEGATEGESYTLVPYGERIAQRNNMGFINAARSGGKIYSTAQIVKDVITSNTDYLTCMFGGNESGAVSTHPLGEIDSEDTNTFYGAYNDLMRYCLTINPKMKILLITPIFDRTQNKDFCQAVINVAKRWGCGYINTYGDPHIPLTYQNAKSPELGICEEAKTLRAAVMRTDGVHPTQAGADAFSTIVEGYMRLL